MIKNYTSNSKQTFDKILKSLSTHGANKIFFEYDDVGKIKKLAFSLSISGHDYSFVLPAKVEAVRQIFEDSGYSYKEDQPYRTAWANIKDWIEAQMALVETNQVKMEEVFLPYLMTGENQTLFQQMESKQFLLEQ